MSFQAWPNKDPDANLDFSFDWSDVLEGDTIQTSTWIVPSDLTGSAQSNTTTSATIWLAGGVVGKTYEITNRIVTVLGRTDDMTALLMIAQQ